MARFDLFRLPDDQGYVVDVQSSHASDKAKTRVVVPLIPAADLGPAVSYLNPMVRIGSQDHAFLAKPLATLTIDEMGERVGALMADHGDTFDHALDILFNGF